MQRALSSSTLTADRVTPTSREHAALVVLRPFVAKLRGDDFLLVTDANLSYVAAAGAAAEWCGGARHAIPGASAQDFFAAPSADRLMALECQVLRTGRALPGHIDIAMRRDGRSRWFSLTREPVRLDNEICVATIGRSLETAPRAACLRRIAQHLPGSGKPVSQLNPAPEEDDAAQREFGISARVYLTKSRLARAIDLIDSGADVAAAAKSCGYGTQSALTRRFQAVAGMAPTQFCELAKQLRAEAVRPTAANSANARGREASSAGRVQ